MSPKELAWITTRGIFTYPLDDGFMLVFQDDCPMLAGVQCRLHEGAKPEVCRKAECLRGVPWFDAAVKYYFPGHDYQPDKEGVKDFCLR